MQKNAVKFSPSGRKEREMEKRKSGPFWPHGMGRSGAIYWANNCSACATESGLPTSMNFEPL